MLSVISPIDMLITSKDPAGFNLPDFIVPGAAKSGTTTLYKLLQQHPSIYFPKGKKEPFYFSFGGKKPDYTDHEFVSNMVWNTQEYVNLFKDAPKSSLLGDASTSYLYTAENSIANMQMLYGEKVRDVKVFIILRNPIYRAYSHYTYLVRNGLEDLSFEDAINPECIASRKRIRWGYDYIQYGMYYEQVSAFMKSFDFCEVYLTEDLKDAQGVCNKIFKSMGLEPVAVRRDVNANPSGIPKNQTAVNLLRKNKVLKSIVGLFPERFKSSMLIRRDKMMEKLLDKEEMKPSAKAYLREAFSEDIDKLATLINRDLSHWLK
jgi:hypothetical protein